MISSNNERIRIDSLIDNSKLIMNNVRPILTSQMYFIMYLYLYQYLEYLHVTI